MRRDGPFAGLEYEGGTKFLRAHYASLKKAGLAVEPSFEAWARANGFLIASNHGWDDARRRRVHSLNEILEASERSDFRSSVPGIQSAESQLRPIAYGKRRPRSRRRRPGPSV